MKNVDTFLSSYKLLPDFLKQLKTNDISKYTNKIEDCFSIDNSDLYEIIFPEG